MSQARLREAMAHLHDYLKRELTPDLAAEVRRHLERAGIASLTPASRKTSSLMLESAGDGRPALVKLRARILAALRAEARRQTDPVPLPLAAVVSAPGVAGIAWRAGTLTATGAAGSMDGRAFVLSGTGWQGGAVLAAFFISSNLVSRRRPGDAAGDLDPKGDRRDLWQVYANGGAAALGAVGSARSPLGIWLVTASLAAPRPLTPGQPRSALWSRVPPRLLWSGRAGTAGDQWRDDADRLRGRRGGSPDRGGHRGLRGRDAGPLPGRTLIGFAGNGGGLDPRRGLPGPLPLPRCEQPSEWRGIAVGLRRTRRAGSHG